MYVWLLITLNFFDVICSSTRKIEFQNRCCALLFWLHCCELCKNIAELMSFAMFACAGLEEPSIRWSPDQSSLFRGVLRDRVCSVVYTMALLLCVVILTAANNSALTLSAEAPDEVAWSTASEPQVIWSTSSRYWHDWMLWWIVGCIAAANRLIVTSTFLFVWILRRQQ